MKQILIVIGILLMVSNVSAVCPCSGNHPCNRTVIDFNDTHNLIIESTYLCGDVNGDNIVSPSDLTGLTNYIYGGYSLHCNPPIITYYYEQKMVNKTINITSSYDGYIAYNYGCALIVDNHNRLLSGYQTYPMSETFRAFIEFDISEIPTNANITNLTFKYDGHNHNIDCNISNMTIQPSNSTPVNIYNDIGSYTIYANESGFPVVGNDQAINLGIDAINDLQIAINKSDWFSIGIKSVDEASPTVSVIYALEHVGVAPPPTLMIDYQVPATSEPEREELNIMFHEYNMHINIISNPLEYMVTKLDNQVGTNIIRPRRLKIDD